MVTKEKCNYSGRECTMNRFSVVLRASFGWMSARRWHGSICCCCCCCCCHNIRWGATKMRSNSSWIEGLRVKGENHMRRRRMGWRCRFYQLRFQFVLQYLIILQGTLWSLETLLGLFQWRRPDKDQMARGHLYCCQGSYIGAPVAVDNKCNVSEQ